MSTRPYFEFEHDGEPKTIEADTWILDDGVLSFYKYSMSSNGVREQNLVEAFDGVDPQSINKVIP